MKVVVLAQKLQWGQVKEVERVEACRGVEMIGTEVGGRQVDVVVAGRVIVEKLGQLALAVGEATRPCQYSLSARGKLSGKWHVAAASGKTSTRRGRRGCCIRGARAAGSSSSLVGLC